VCPLARVEIKNDVCWLINPRSAMQKGMQLNTGHVCRPCQGRDIIDENVINVRPALPSRHWICLYPFRCKSGGIFFVEGFAVNAIRITLQRHRPSLKMRQQKWRYSDVIIDYVGFGEFDYRIENLLGIRDCQLSFADIQ